MAQSSSSSDRQRKYLHASSSSPSSSRGGTRGTQQKPMQPMHNIKVAINTTAPSQPKQNALPRPRSTLNRPGAGQPNTPSQGLPASSGQQGRQQPAKKVSLPKHPPKEPKPPKDVKKARKQQTAVLKERQKRETQGKMKPGMRDVDAGAGTWPPLSPLL